MDRLEDEASIMFIAGARRCAFASAPSGHSQGLDRRPAGVVLHGCAFSPKTRNPVTAWELQFVI